jgi:hypothetical protein
MLKTLTLRIKVFTLLNAPHVLPTHSRIWQSLTPLVGKEGDITDKSSEAAIRLGVRKAADKRHLERFAKRIFKEGIRAGIQAKEAETRVIKQKKKIETRKRRQLRESAQAIPDVDIRPELVAERVDTTELVDNVVQRVKEAMPNADSVKLLASIQKTLHKALTQANGTISNARTRASVAKKLVAFKAKTDFSEKAMIESAAKIAEQINRGALKQNEAALIKRVNKGLKDLAKDEGVRKEGVKRKKLAPLTAWAQAAKKAAAMSVEKRQSLIADFSEMANDLSKLNSEKEQAFKKDILKAYPSLGLFDEMSIQELATLSLDITTTFGAIKSMPLSQLQDAVERINNTVAANQIQLAAMKQERKQFVDSEKRDIVDGLVSAETVTPSDRASNVAKLLSSLTGLRSMFKIISATGKGESRKKMQKLFSKYLRRWNRADQDLRLEEFGSHNKFLDDLADIYNVNIPGVESIFKAAKDSFDVLRELKRKRDDYAKYSLDKTTPLSKLDLLQKYGQAVQEDASKSVEKHGYDIDGMANEFSDVDWRLLEWYRGWYAESLEQINPVLMDVAGTRIDQREALYLPFVRVNEKGGGIRETHNAMSVFPQYFKDRQNLETAFSEEWDIHDVWLMRMAETSRFKHFARLNLDLRDVLLSKEVVGAVAKAHGGPMADAYQDKLGLQILGYVSNNTVAGKGFENSVNLARKFWVGSKFFLIKQLSSIPAFAWEMGLMNTMHYAKDFFSKDGFAAAKEILAHPLSKERMKLGNSEALRSFLQNTNPSRFKRLLQMGRLPNTVGDIAPILFIGQGMYRSKINELTEAGWSEDAAKEEAISMLFEMTESTQQSGRAKDLADIQLIDSVWGKLLLTFKSTVRQYLEKEIVDFIALIRAEKGERGQAFVDFGKTFALNHILLPGLYNGLNIIINAFLGDSPDEDDIYLALMSMAMGPFSAIPVFGSMIAGWLEGVTTGKSSSYGDVISPIAGAITDVKAFGAVVNAMAPWTDAALDEALDRLMKSTFAPYREIRKATE